LGGERKRECDVGGRGIMMKFREFGIFTLHRENNGIWWYCIFERKKKLVIKI
jgi:hypothetical protein